MRKIAWFLLASNIIFLTLAGVFYNGHYRFWQDPISTLGVTVTEAGQINTAGAVCFGLNMLFCTLGFLALSRLLYQRGHHTWSMAPAIAAIGFMVAAFSPDNLRHQTHVLGMSLGIFMLWLMLTVGFWLQRHKISYERYWIGLLAFQFPIIAYAIIYYTRIDNSAAPWQKLAMVGLSYSLMSLANIFDTPTAKAAGATG